MSHTHCAIQGCKTSIFNKGIGVAFHPCPTSAELRNKWLMLLKNKCAVLDWARSRICSKHFENKYFDSQRKLKDNAIPTLFPVTTGQKTYSKASGNNTELSAPRTKVDRLLNKLTQAELMADIKSNLNKLKEPVNLTDFITDDLQCKHDAPVEAKLWLMNKKQDHLNTRLMELVVKNKKHVETLQKNMEEMKSAKKEMERNIETYKYIVKCLQEKHATLEEQIEILSAVESR